MAEKETRPKKDGPVVKNEKSQSAAGGAGKTAVKKEAAKAETKGAEKRGTAKTSTGAASKTAEKKEAALKSENKTAEKSGATKTSVGVANNTAVKKETSPKAEKISKTTEEASKATLKKQSSAKADAASSAKTEQKNSTVTAEKSKTSPKKADNVQEELAASAVAETKKSAQSDAARVTNTREKSSKTEKTSAAHTNEKKSFSLKELFVRWFPTKRAKTIFISAVSFVLIIAIVLGIVLGTQSCQSGGPTVDPDKKDEYTYEYKSTTLVGFSSETLGTVEREIPQETVDEGLGESIGYPKYGYTLGNVLGMGEEQVAARNALIAESNYLCAKGTSNASGGGSNYTWMDKEGYLYSGSTAEPVEAQDSNGQHRRLYKHTASVGMYLGDVAEDEPGIVKRVTMRPRGYNGYGVTGVYAPAGEVIQIQISEADMNATGGITIHIGQALYNGQANNIWTAKNQMQRFPVILNTMTVNKTTATLDKETKMYTAYVGSFIGGPLYIRNTNATFTATISGGVAYSHFILGYTTKEEFEENAKSSAPYFDLEVWNYGVLHSGPKHYAKNFSYEDLYKAAVLWEKISIVTTTGSSQGIVFIYDAFVAAGAAVAFPGRRSVNCPAGWMSNSLNYNGIVNSGAWGNLHEYHHNFQGYGVGNGGEVTNNGMTLVSYAEFTRISAARNLNAYGAGGMGGWNCYTSATWALDQVMRENPSNGRQGLALYATLLHNFGSDNYIQSKVRQQSKGYGQTYTGYLRAWQDITHNDMTYYFKDILGGISEEVAQQWSNPDYSMFVPVSSVFQTGRSYMYDGEKKYFNTMQPYVIPYGEEFTVDLNAYKMNQAGMYESGSIILPQGFSYRIKKVTQPEHGRLNETGTKGVYKFVPDTNMRSGKIYVTLEITKNDGAFKGDDVDLVLEFEQSHETNKMTLERTTYYYNDTKKYSDAQTAYESGYAGYERVSKDNHNNPVQNCNTDIWYYVDNEANREKYPNSPDIHFAAPNSVAEVKGKLYIQEEGKYRLYLRGRNNCALYYSLDGENYKLGATIKDPAIIGNSAYFRPNDEKTYVDLDLPAESWIHIKEVLIAEPLNGSQTAYIGVGLKQWTKPMFTMVEKFYDSMGNEVASKDDVNYHHTETHYYDYQGHEVSEEVANAAEPIPPVINNGNQPYVNAYRSSYEFNHATFETDYFYTRKYNYNYEGSPDYVIQGKTQTPTADCNYVPWSTDGTHDIQHLFDGKADTGIHFNKNWGVSESRPAILAFDTGEAVTANSMILYTYLQTGSNSKGFPSNFKLEGSLDGQTYFEMGSWTNQGQPSVSKEFTFTDNKTFTFRYYRLTVTSTANGRVALNGISFKNTFRLTGNGNNLFSPDDKMFMFVGKWQGVQAQSTFGHIYLGQKGAKLKFNFTGTRLAVLSSNRYGKNFEVYIDGKKVDSVAVKEDNGPYAVTYISQKLEDKKHTVEIRCTGETSIDSIATYTEQ